MIYSMVVFQILRFFCMISLENYLSRKAILADATIVTFVGSFSFLLKPKNRFISSHLQYSLPLYV